MVRLVAALIVLAASMLVGAGAALANPGPILPQQDPFYRYSRPLVGISPGTVLRSRAVTLAGSGSAEPITAAQVLYRTTGELGQSTVTVATILRPARTTAGSKKIVSYQTPYDALGAQCDPSYTLQGGASGDAIAAAEEGFLLAFVNQGYTVVVSDYEGEQLDWEAGQESGYGTLDGIRAAERYLRLPGATTPVGMIGYSGGSIATEFASELAPTYSPSLHIVGTAEGGVPVDLFHNLAYINGSPSWSGVIPASFVAVSRAFGLSLGAALSPYGLQLTRQVQHECINSFLGAYPGLTYQKLFQPQYRDIFKLPSFVAVTDRLIMSHTGTPRGPLLIGVGNSDGTGDGVMVARDVQALAYAYCRRDVSVQFHEYAGDNHYAAAVAFEREATAFLQARLAGKAVPNGCSSIQPGNSLASVPVPQSSLLHFLWLGPRPASRGIAVELWTPHGTQRDVSVTLAIRAHAVDRLHFTSIGTKRRTLVLRADRRMPPPGPYTVTVTIDGGSLIWQQHRVG